LPPIHIQKTCITIQIKVKANKKKSEIVFIDDEFIHVALHAQPIEGKANTELISFFSTFFGIAKQSIKIIRGEKSKIKTLSLPAHINLDLLNKINFRRNEALKP
jgi:uncharacterized protein (TIGR00251 family)